MKNYTVIQFNIAHLKARLVAKEHEHSKLHQIDMLSSTGNRIREEISVTKGLIKALEWVTNDNINGEL